MTTKTKTLPNTKAFAMAENDSSTSPISGSSQASPWYRRPSFIILVLASLSVGIILAVVLGVTFGDGQSASSQSSSSSSSSSGRPESNSTKPPQAPGEIVLGETSNNVPYYSCTHNDRDEGKQIVLLHGGAFSKETWLSHDMMAQFCSSGSSARTVVALDLSASANHQDLIRVLEALADDQIVDLPAVTLVTPSASGYTIIDWMINGDIRLLSNYVSTWVPVATGSLTLASDDQVASLLDAATIEVLAIHGNEDTAGGRYSNRLGDLADATVVELVGRHAVYLQSPDDFVRTILEF